MRNFTSLQILFSFHNLLPLLPPAPFYTIWYGKWLSIISYRYVEQKFIGKSNNISNFLKWNRKINCGVIIPHAPAIPFLSSCLCFSFVFFFLSWFGKTEWNTMWCALLLLFQVSSLCVVQATYVRNFDRKIFGCYGQLCFNRHMYYINIIRTHNQNSITFCLIDLLFAYCKYIHMDIGWPWVHT